MMIDDDEVGFFSALVHGGDEALVEVIALLSGAGVTPGIEAGPEIGIVRKKSQFAAVPGFGEFGPFANLAESVNLLEAFQQRLMGHLIDAGVAEKIRTALHHRDF